MDPMGISYDTFTQKDKYNVLGNTQENVHRNVDATPKVSREAGVFEINTSHSVTLQGGLVMFVITGMLCQVLL